VFPGGNPSLSLVAAIAGLAIAAWRGPLVVPARFFALMLLIAVVGSVRHQVPLGPPIALGRVSLWLVPAMAFGVGTVLEFGRRIVARSSALRWGFDAIAIAAAVLVLLSATGVKHVYPNSARLATRQVMTELGPHDVVLITQTTTFSFALYANTPVSLQATPRRAIGFVPAFTDRRLPDAQFLAVSPGWGDPVNPSDVLPHQKEFASFVKDADRVFVVDADNVFSGKYVFPIAVGLKLRGFEPVSTTKVGSAHVSIWRRPTPEHS
jgi:hypothetical protein